MANRSNNATWGFGPLRRQDSARVAGAQEGQDHHGLLKNHLHNIFYKLGVSDRLELVLYAIHRNIRPV